MDLEDLRTLLAVAQAGSVKGAARDLGRSRSSVRRGLERLEARVGTALVLSEPDGARLTPAGEVVVDRGRGLLAEGDRLLAEAGEAQASARGAVRLVLPPGLPFTLRSRLLFMARTAYPEMRIVDVEADEPLDLVDGPFELMLHHGEPPDRGTWFSRTVLRMRTGLLASPAYLRARGVPETPESLVDHDLLGWRTRGLPGDRWPLTRGGELRVEPWLISGNLEMLRAVASRDGGVLCGGLIPVADDPPVGELVPVLEDEVRGELVVRVLMPLPSEVEPRVRAVVTSIQAGLAAMVAER